jgi:hypothetical protein
MPLAAAVREKLNSAKLPSKASGKSSVRHLLRHYADIACGPASGLRHPFSDVPPRVNGSLPGFVVEDGSVTFMDAAGRLAAVPPKTEEQLRGGLAKVSARVIFERLSRRVRFHLGQPGVVAHVFAVDKPSFVPAAKREEQQRRDESFKEAYDKTVSAVLRDARTAFAPTSTEMGDAKRIAACKDAFALRDEFLGEGCSQLNSVSCGLCGLDSLALPGMVWTLLVQCRATRAVIIDFFMGLDDEWRKLQPRGKTLYRDWESPTEGTVCVPDGANSVGEADLSWIHWDKFLRARHPGHAGCATALLTVDTDVIFIALLNQKVSEVAVPAPLLCMLKAGEGRGDLWIDSDALRRMAEELFDSGVRGLIRSAVIAGGSDFTSESAFPGVSIMRSVDCARRGRYNDDGALMRAVYAAAGERALATAARSGAAQKRKRDAGMRKASAALPSAGQAYTSDVIVKRGLTQNAAATDWTIDYWKAHMVSEPCAPSEIAPFPTSG